MAFSLKDVTKEMTESLDKLHSEHCVVRLKQNPGPTVLHGLSVIGLTD
jgi:hypothetical protein